MLDTAIAQLLTTASALPAVQVRPATESVRVTDGVTRILFTQIAGPRGYNDDGADGIVPARYQLDIFAPQLSVARTLAQTVLVALDGYKGTVAGTRIDRIYFPDGRFSAASVAPGANNTPARHTIELVIVHRET